MSNIVSQQLEHVHTRIKAACVQAGRSPAEVQLLAVTKTKPISDIVLAYAAGQHMFGESYWQEAQSKIISVAHCHIDWHFIGRLQSRKCVEIAQHFAWVQSVWREKELEKLNIGRTLRPELPPLNICIEVNIDNDPNKAGLAVQDVPALLNYAQRFERLCVRGLMAIPALTQNVAERRTSFEKNANIIFELKTAGYALDTLSMGMSDDFELAIACGSTLVRIGTLIFGER